jgi:hypothetical protein
VVSVMPQPCFSPGERTPGTHSTGDWVGPKAGLDTEARGKIFSPLLGIEPRSPGRPAHSQTLYRLSYPAHLPPCPLYTALRRSLSSAEIKNAWSFTSTPSVHIDSCVVRSKSNFLNKAHSTGHYRLTNLSYTFQILVN